MALVSVIIAMSVWLRAITVFRLCVLPVIPLAFVYSMFSLVMLGIFFLARLFLLVCSILRLVCWFGSVYPRVLCGSFGVFMGVVVS